MYKITKMDTISALFPRSSFMFQVRLGAEVAVLNFEAVPISQVVLKPIFTVLT